MKKKKDSLITNYNIDNKMKLLFEYVNKTQNIVDNKMYENIIETLLKYSEIINDYCFYNFSMSYFLELYVEYSSDLIIKYSRDNNDKAKIISDFINSYANSSLDYKYYVFNEFKKVGIIEERAQQHFISSNNYLKKMLQVLSVFYRNNNDKTLELIFEKSKVNKLQEKAKKIVNFILELNRKSKLINQVELVKPTLDSMEITCCLPEFIVDNEDDFKKLIDFLYKLFWDNSQHIRNYALNGELNIINSIRTYFYHDIDHGENSKVKKKYKAVKEFYKEACGKVLPENAKEWQKVQELLYDKLLSFLDSIQIKEEV